MGVKSIPAWAEQDEHGVIWEHVIEVITRYDGDKYTYRRMLDAEIREGVLIIDYVSDDGVNTEKVMHPLSTVMMSRSFVERASF